MTRSLAIEISVQHSVYVESSFHDLSEELVFMDETSSLVIALPDRFVLEL